MKTFKIKVINFEKHNPNRRQSYKKIFLTNNFFNDHKVSSLTATQKLLFIFLITQAGDQGSSTIALSERQLSYVIGTGQRPESVLGALQSFQLVTYEKFSLIEEKRIEEKRIERTVVMSCRRSKLQHHACQIFQNALKKLLIVSTGFR
jgi:hypothetical protein